MFASFCAHLHTHTSRLCSLQPVAWGTFQKRRTRRRETTEDYATKTKSRARLPEATCRRTSSVASSHSEQLKDRSLPLTRLSWRLKRQGWFSKESPRLFALVELTKTEHFNAITFAPQRRQPLSQSGSELGSQRERNARTLASES